MNHDLISYFSEFLTDSKDLKHLAGTPALACRNLGFGINTECADIPTPFGPGKANCACGEYVGGSVPSPTVCQANVLCATCTRGCTVDSDCPGGYNCAGSCGAVRIGANGVCLPNCGTAPAASGC